MAEEWARDTLRLARRARLADIDRRATALYDKLNPNWQTKINVSKADCIERVLGRRRRILQPAAIST